MLFHHDEPIKGNKKLSLATSWLCRRFGLYFIWNIFPKQCCLEHDLSLKIELSVWLWDLCCPTGSYSTQRRLRYKDLTSILTSKASRRRHLIIASSLWHSIGNAFEASDRQLLQEDEGMLLVIHDCLSDEWGLSCSNPSDHVDALLFAIKFPRRIYAPLYTLQFDGA